MANPSSDQTTSRRRLNEHWVWMIRRVIAGASLMFLAVTLGHPAARTVHQLVQLADLRIRNWHNLEDALRTPGTGREAIPKEINAAIDSLKARHAVSFHLAPGFLANDLIRQRIEEGAWPIAYDPASAVLVHSGNGP